MNHVITEKRWSDPFLGRRGSLECTCGLVGGGAVAEVMALRERHEKNTEADKLITAATQPEGAKP